MSRTVILKNDRLVVEISTHGAEMHSVKMGGAEYLWNGDEKYWGFHAPVMWPICGGLKDGKFTYKGASYELGKHGYGRFCEFECESAQNESAVFLLKSDEESKKQFPFDYEFRITYTLKGSSIEVMYTVMNKTDGEMYFSVGAHEAYMCENGINAARLDFERSVTLESARVDGNLLNGKTVPMLNDESTLKLSDKLFENDALIFRKIDIHTVKLTDSTTKKTVTVDYPGFDNLLVWTKPGAPYVCIEPWCGEPDSTLSSGNIAEKSCIKRLEKGGVFTAHHTITLGKEE